MKKHILKLLALALCAVSLLSLTALAEEAVSPEEADTEKTTAEDELPAAPAAVLYWGTVTKQEDGSLLLDETGAVHRLGVPRGKVVNSVGAGDSMVAGFLAGWLETRDYAAAHRMGAAAGSATAFSDRLATGPEIRALLNAF